MTLHEKDPVSMEVAAALASAEMTVRRWLESEDRPRHWNEGQDPNRHGHADAELQRIAKALFDCVNHMAHHGSSPNAEQALKMMATANEEDRQRDSHPAEKLAVDQGNLPDDEIKKAVAAQHYERLAEIAADESFETATGEGRR